MRARLRSRTFVVLVAMVAVMAIGATVVMATDDFSDVPNGAFYHSAVGYIVDRNVTAGCGGGKYCPNNSVTRGQMAVFLRASMNAVTPTFITETAGTGAIDLDAPGKECVTDSYTPAFPQVARIDSWISIESTGALTWVERNYYSTNGGTTWTNLDSASVSRGSVTAGSLWSHLTNSATLNLTPGTTYTFSVEADRLGGSAGTGDASDGRCEIIVQIENRNA